MQNVVTKNLTNYYTGEVFHGVEIVDEDDLPRGCSEVAWIMAEEDYNSYVIHKDSVTGCLYATFDR